MRRTSLVPTRKIASFLGALPFSALPLAASSALDLGFLTGSGNETAGYDPDSTMGRQLLDLQKFYETGVISEAEYDRAKKDILWRYDD